MKNLLNRSKAAVWWRDDDGALHEDGSLPPGLSGDVDGLRGDVSGLSGDVDKCEITEDERNAGLDVESLVRA